MAEPTARTEVDGYVERSRQWPDEVRALRAVLADTGLDEALKWGKPCYVHDGANIVIIQEMKDFLALMFFKGALLTDPDGVLEDQGPNTRSARRMTFTSVADVERAADTVRRYVAEAVANEDAGLEVAPADQVELVEELARRLAADPALTAAFEALTPGRQREYHLYIAEAKQPATRERRVDASVPNILAGKGRRDR